MGKRSDFKRHDRDFYRTPREAVLPLLPHLPKWGAAYVEPCAGDGALIDLLPGVCVGAYDILPGRRGIVKADALRLTREQLLRGGLIITNPPWDRKVLHPMIEHFSANTNGGAWLLFDADWAHTKQSAPYMQWCHKIVSVGRVKWFPDSKMTGKDNVAWYLFNQSRPAATEFVGRAA
jgi:hypothetical protein